MSLRVLLDTHALLWWVADSQRLSPSAYRATGDESNDVLISAATAWEIATKHRLGKLQGAEAVAVDIVGTLADQGFDKLPISVEDAARAGALPGIHRDPFDRILIAQAIAHNLVLISNEALFDQYGVRRLW